MSSTEPTPDRGRPRRWREFGEPPEGTSWDAPIGKAALAFVDLEMTGLDVERDRVVELCIERLDESGVRRLDSLVRPGDGRSGNEDVHGIRPEDVARAPTFEELTPRVRELLDGAIVVAHAAAWDVAFLEAEFARTGEALAIPHFLDTLELARRAFGFRRHSLDALCGELGIARARAHRAADDVAALRGIFAAILHELEPSSPRDLWHVKTGAKHARPRIVHLLEKAVELGVPAKIRYRPSGKRPMELELVIVSIDTTLDPPRVLGYGQRNRARRELRIDRILAVELPILEAPSP
jgi:DNA polymerase-3 subunit epsilon